MLNNPTLRKLNQKETNNINDTKKERNIPLQNTKRKESQNFNLLEEIKKDSNISDRNLIEKDKEKMTKEEIKSNLESYLNKFTSLHNNLIFKFDQYLKYLICKKENVKNSYKILDFYPQKLYDKFDIFYYFKQDNKFEILQKIMFKEEQSELINLVSNKNFRICLSQNESLNEDLLLKDEKLKYNVLNYLMKCDNDEVSLEQSEKKNINCFLG